jgi:methylglutaconyl-CoA hydratase
MGEFVRIDLEQRGDGTVAKVVLNRPDVHNAFNEVMIRELHQAFATLGRQSDVRVIVLAGEGKSFCAGADLNWMQKMVDYTFAENVQDAHGLASMLRTIHACAKPVIARIHGAAFGGGVGLIAACDIAIATEASTFCLSEVKLGLLPAVISPFVLKKIGAGAAHRYFLTAERFTAAEALRLELISEMASDVTALDATIDRLTEAIIANGPEAVSQCKILIEHVCHFEWDRAVDITTKMIAERRASAEGQEGMRAFLDKRSPVWPKPHAPAKKAPVKG